MKHFYFNFSKKIFKSTIIFLMIIFLVFPTFTIQQKMSTVYAEESDSAKDDAVSAVAGCLASVMGLIGANMAANIISVPTSDKPTETTTGMETVKDCILDGLANVLKRRAIRSLVSTTVDWINGGFDGSPQYGKNLAKTLKKTVDDVLGEVIYNSENLKFLCSDFEFPLKLGLYLEFSKAQFQEYDYTPKCSLSDVAKNVRNSIEDGVNYYSNTDNFFNITTNGSDNIYQTYFHMSDQMEKLIGQRNATKLNEYNRNSGFFGFRECSDGSEYDGSKESEAKCPVTTPGRILSERLASVTNTENDELITADEFDEIIGAILNQLFQKLLQKEGIRGMSDTSADTGTTALEDYRKVGSALDTEDHDDIIGDDYVNYVYNTQTPDVMIATIESILRVLNRSISIFSQNKQCWASKSAGDLRRRGGNSYTKLQQATINEANQINVWLTEAEALKIEYQEKLAKVKQYSAEYKAISERIQNADASERGTIMSEVGDDPVVQFINSLAEVAQEKVEIENDMDEKVNGKYTYSGSSAKKTYSAAAYLRYCRSFSIPHDGSVSCSDRGISCNLSVGFWELQNTSDVTVEDSYDPIEAIEDMRNGSSGDITSSTVGQCTSADGKTINYGDTESNFYTKDNGVLYIHEGGGVCGAGSIITDQLCNSPHKSSEVYLYSTVLSSSDITKKVTINSEDKCDVVEEEEVSCETFDGRGFEDGDKISSLYTCNEENQTCYKFNDVKCREGSFIGCDGGKYLYDTYASKKDGYTTETGSCE